MKVSPPAASGVAETTGTVTSIGPGVYKALYTATLKRNNRFGTDTRHDVSVKLGSCASAGNLLYIPVPDVAGLQATFYSANSLASPFAFVEGLMLDWSQVGLQRYHRSLPSAAQFAAKWKGFVRPTMRGLYTFYLQTAAADSAAILVESDSATLPTMVAGSERTATFFVPAGNALYSVAVFATLNSAANSQLRLQWENKGLTFSAFQWTKPVLPDSLSKTVIPVTSMFAIRSLPTIVRDDSADYYGGSEPVGCLSSSAATGVDAYIKYSNCFGPGTRTLDILHVDVRPAQVCAVTSAALPGSLMFLTLTTAGVTSTFDVVLKDQFGNVRDTTDDVVAIALAVRPGGKYFSAGAQCIRPTYAYATAGDPSGRYTVEYVATYAGQYWLTVSAGDGSSTGLTAQYCDCVPFARFGPICPSPMCRYFGNPYLNGSFVSRLEAVNASCSSSPLLHSASFPDQDTPSASQRANTVRGFGWSARWSGLYRPVATGVATLYLQHSAGRSSVFVNNVLVGEAEAAQGGSALVTVAVNITCRYYRNTAERWQAAAPHRCNTGPCRR